LAEALAAQAWTAFHVGRWDMMAACAEEAERLADETRRVGLTAATRMPPAILAALRGEVARAERTAEEIEQAHLPLGAASALAFVQLTRGLAALSDGRRAEAFAHLHRLWEPGDVAHHAFTAPGSFTHLVDAGAGTDDEPALREVLAEVAALTAATGSPRLRDALLYAYTVLAPDDEAEERFVAALNGDVELLPFTRARLLSHYGAWLRRRRRVAESRAPLRAAREAADALGALTWGERARQELRATGEASQTRVEDARDRLTPQELEIARMAASGLTNRAIGEQLYLSHRTVASHLYRVFPKLGITGRAQLAGALEVPDLEPIS
jgi:DNA-binding CsgD family transcriptional regulator